MKTIFITGVSGFVGINLVRYLQNQSDIRIIGHCRNINAVAEKFKSLRIELVSKVDAETLDRLNVDCVIHLAGIAHDLSGRFQLEDYEKVNVGLTSHYYDEFLKSKATSFIFMSSIKAAVDVSSIPVTEDVIPSPVTDYGKSKRKAEVHIETTPCPPEKHFYIFRPSMIYGKGNKGNLNLLYRFIKSGMPYPLGAFENQRSFLFVDNLNFIIEKFIKNNYKSGIYHLADRAPISTVDLVKLMSKIMKKRPSVWMIPKNLARLGAQAGSWLHLSFNDQTLQKLTESMVVSNQKVMKVLGMALPYDKEEGLKITLNSFRE